MRKIFARLFAPAKPLPQKIAAPPVAATEAGPIAVSEAGPLAVTDEAGPSDRAYWVNLLTRIVQPVVSHLAAGTLKKNMPVVAAPDYTKSLGAHTFAHLEAVGRTLAGLAPWLALPDDDTPEGVLRLALRRQVLRGLPAVVNPHSPDYLNFRTGSQPLVDAAYLAQGFLQAPQQLWQPLNAVTQQRFIEEFKELRKIKPPYNNWLLFAGLVETFLLSVGAAYDPLRIDIAWRKCQEWYVGDGWYQDGPKFAFDYYNSYVIHPMLVLLLEQLAAHRPQLAPPEADALALQRMTRYAELLERMISPEGYYPPVGRSLTYRAGVFHALGQTALRHKLPAHIAPAQVRCGLTAVLKNQFTRPGTFDDNGWLQLGFAGHQPTVADRYTCNGSLYLCTLGFIALGLPAQDPFWTDPPTDWTAKKAWSGQPFPKDYQVSC